MSDISGYVSAEEMRQIAKYFGAKSAACIVAGIARSRGCVDNQLQDEILEGKYKIPEPHLYETDYKFL